MQKLQQGERMPNFTVSTLNRNETNFSSLVNKKPTFFWFLRYFGCTVCRYDVHELTERYSEFASLGVNVVVIMQSTPEIVNRDLNGAHLPFEFVCDPELKLYKALDINAAESEVQLVPQEIKPALTQLVEKATVLGMKHGDREGIEEQLPAMFLVNADMTVSYSHYGAHLLDSPSIDEMLSLIK